MKRRNVDCGKLRRPMKRSKITEGIYGSTFLYMKFLLVWALVLMADFILEFRFEYLWPFWLLLRSVYDSFKYQGLAFSAFFVCIAATSDVVCYLFIPVQWLFFAASTYVWVQYVWHTERGICLPTVSLWLLFVYIEMSVRLRELKSLPFHMDLCRPFAAHCIGYPVVTLGFGFKSYVSYRLRLRRQKEVQRQNDSCVQLIQKALPPEQRISEKQKLKTQEEAISNVATSTSSSTSLPHAPAAVSTTTTTTTSSVSTTSSTSPAVTTSNSTMTSTRRSASSSSKVDDSRKQNNSGSGGGHQHRTPSPHITDLQYIEQSASSTKDTGTGGSNCCRLRTNNLYNNQDSATVAAADIVNDDAVKPSYNKLSNGSVPLKSAKLNSHRDNVSVTGAGGVQSSGGGGGSGGKRGKNNNTAAAAAMTASSQMANTQNKEEVITRLESDVKRLKADLQSSRNGEQELRSHINNLSIGDKVTKSELYQLRQDNESLQTKLHNLVTSRQQDKQNLAILERRLVEERKQKAITEQLLATEKKAKRAEEAVAARAVALATQARNECTEVCKTRQRDLEVELKQLHREMKVREGQLMQLDREAQSLRQYKEKQNDSEVLMSALTVMQDKTSHLEKSLSAETRLKLDLFSALGEAKRQIEIHQEMMMRKTAEIAELKAKIAEVLALVPTTSVNFTSISTNSPPHFSSSFTQNALVQNEDGRSGDMIVMSSLNPNACDYLPNNSNL